ncbi:FAD-dependent oxidoreductase [Deinococcus deserti]|uniref:Putative FAD dependent oxidoreductase n=1 Tax=Deinococcus deserti (strain DSM 17065 / CIP 109153 / LMG 22923 / VCD115) TaxID=546414 RepID=C1CUW3_DEIDV|nr:FAD-dependent oxidoreductase [Deinococcus deserti]ACO45980.1 putative FAD dependent oxidoreductase [Deinococcus deserti VCD115]
MTTSHWALPPPSFAPLIQDLEADTVVVGGGIAGVTTAYLLACEGQRVVLLERDEIGSGETSRSSAQLTASLDFRYFELAALHGEDRARLIARSHLEAVDEIERIASGERIACDLVRLPSFLFAPPEQQKDLMRELAAMQSAGLNVQMVDPPAGTLNLGPCLRLEHQAAFHPVRYLQGLAEAAQRRGAKIYTHSAVTSYDSTGVVTQNGARVHAAHVVLATNVPVADRVKFSFRLEPYRTYMISLDLTAAIEPGHYWDTVDPYHYVRLDGDLLLVGGEDHVVGRADDAEKRYRCLEVWAREHFPVGQRREAWSGQVENTPDGLAYIGESAGVYVVTGDVGNGLTHGTIGALVIRDLILGRENAWTELYDANRVPRGNRLEWLKEGITAAAHLGEWVTGGDDPTDIAPGEGAVIRQGIRKLAVYRDEHGELHTRSAMCPHFGCVVHWNTGEKSWDCPCHGSRFTAFGDLLHGPARTGLAAEDLSSDARTPD